MGCRHVFQSVMMRRAKKWMEEACLLSFRVSSPLFLFIYLFIMYSILPSSEILPTEGATNDFCKPQLANLFWRFVHFLLRLLLFVTPAEGSLLFTCLCACKALNEVANYETLPRKLSITDYETI